MVKMYFDAVSCVCAFSPSQNLLFVRYLSHGQEWSEKFRLEKQTVVVRRSLDPVWDEEFMLPVRRYGK